MKNQSHSNCSTREEFGALLKDSRKTSPLAGQGSELTGNSSLCAGHGPVGRGPYQLDCRGDVSSLQIMNSNYNIPKSRGFNFKFCSRLSTGFLEPHYCQLSSPWACAEGLGGRREVTEEEEYLKGKPKGKWGADF